MTTQTLHIPRYHPPTVNQLLQNRWKAAKLKKQCVMVFWHSILEQKLVKASGRRMVEIVITVANNKPGRRPDKDAHYKSTLDALVKCNMLVDDSTRWCDHAATLIVSGEHDATTIKLTDIEELPASPAFKAKPTNSVRSKKRGKGCDI